MMKVVFLIAGKGRRLGALTENNHKSLITLNNKSLLSHLIENFVYAGLTDFVPIVGHSHDMVLSCFDNTSSEKTCVTPIYNPRYEETNNLYSLYCAKNVLAGEEFILCNGDLILDRAIVEGISRKTGLSAIGIDDSYRTSPIDSPGTVIDDNRIYDLGRHIPFEKSGGYAIGLYKFNAELSSAFFDEAENMLNENINAGFHDPLPLLASRYHIHKHSTEERLWTDIDTEDDIPRARELLNKILEENNNYEDARKEVCYIS